MGYGWLGTRVDHPGPMDQLPQLQLRILSLQATMDIPWTKQNINVHQVAKRILNVILRVFILLEVCKLVRYVKDKNPRDYAGNTPLHLAAIDGHSAVYKLLVDNGGNDNLINNQGETANELMVRTLTGSKWNFHY